MARPAIGLDIGPQTVRAVALAPVTTKERRNGVPFRVVATAAVHRKDATNEPRPLAQVVEEALEILGKRGPMRLHLGDSPTLVRFIATMPLPPDRQARVLRLELASNTEDNGDLAADTWVVPQAGDEVIHACVIGQAATLVTALTDLSAAGVRDARIHYGPAAAFNATLPSAPVQGDGLGLLIDLGDTTSSLTLFGDEHILACRQVSLGGSAFPAAPTQFEAPGDGSPQIIAPLERQEERAKVREADDSFDAMLESSVEKPQASAAPAVVPTTTNSKHELSLDEPGFDDLVLDDAPFVPPVQVKSVAESPAPDSISLSELVFDDPTLNDPDAAPIPVKSAPAPMTVSLTKTAIVPAGAMTMVQAQARLSPESIRVAEALYGQFASSLTWFRNQLKRDKIPLAKVLLTGSTATIPGLAEYFQRRFGCPVEIFDPFTGSQGAIPEDPTAWTAAIGLALADPRLGQKHALALDLRPESLVRRDFVRRHLIWPWVAAACVIVATGLFAWTSLTEQASLEMSRQAWVDYQAKHKKLSAELDTVAKDQDALGEDLRAIASRIWAGRDLLNTIRALKERTDKSPELWVTKLETVGIATDQNSTATSGRVGTTAAKSVVDTAIGRGAVLLTGKIKFTAADTDTGRNKFLTEWKDWLTAWRPTTEAPPLFTRSEMIEWDPRHQTKKAKDGSLVDAGEFSFTAKFEFTPTSLDQITATQGAP